MLSNNNDDLMYLGFGAASCSLLDYCTRLTSFRGRRLPKLNLKLGGPELTVASLNRIYFSSSFCYFVSYLQSTFMRVLDNSEWLESIYGFKRIFFRLIFVLWKRICVKKVATQMLSIDKVFPEYDLV